MGAEDKSELLFFLVLPRHSTRPDVLDPLILLVFVPTSSSSFLHHHTRALSRLCVCRAFTHVSFNLDSWDREHVKERDHDWHENERASSYNYKYLISLESRFAKRVMRASSLVRVVRDSNKWEVLTNFIYSTEIKRKGTCRETDLQLQRSSVVCSISCRVHLLPSFHRKLKWSSMGSERAASYRAACLVLVRVGVRDNGNTGSLLYPSYLCRAVIDN